MFARVVLIKQLKFGNVDEKTTKKTSKNYKNIYLYFFS